jgi:hypothetical protein
VLDKITMGVNLDFIGRNNVPGGCSPRRSACGGDADAGRMTTTLPSVFSFLMKFQKSPISSFSK